MKGLLLFLLLCSQTSFAQNSWITVSTAGIGEIKVGMSKSELEKRTGRQFSLKNVLDKNSQSGQDTLLLHHQGIELELVLQNSYVAENRYEVQVVEVKSSSALLKTKSGIGIGDDKLQIISTYGDYLLQLVPDFEKNAASQRKVHSAVLLFSDSNIITFYLQNGKVTAFSVSVHLGC